jgi:hypothetical protein
MGSLDTAMKFASPTGVETARRESYIQNNAASTAVTDVSNYLTVFIFRIWLSTKRSKTSNPVYASHLRDKVVSQFN